MITAGRIVQSGWMLFRYLSLPARNVPRAIRWHLCGLLYVPLTWLVDTARIVYRTCRRRHWFRCDGCGNYAHADWLGSCTGVERRNGKAIMVGDCPWCRGAAEDGICKT